MMKTSNTESKLNVLLYIGKIPESKDIGGGHISFWETIKRLQSYPVNIFVLGKNKRSDTAGLLMEKFPKVSFLFFEEDEDIMAAFEKYSIDIFHAIAFDIIPLLKYCNTKGISTVIEIKHPSISPINYLDLIKQKTPRGRREIPKVKRMKECARYADRIIVPSKYSKQRAVSQLKVPASRIVVSRNGINPSIFAGEENRKEDTKIINRFICTGRLEWDKRIDWILKAFAILQKKYNDIYLDIIGHGTEKRKLELLAERLKLQNVTFHGFVNHDEMRDLYNRSHGLLHASSRESFCNSVAEGMACKLVCIAADVGAIPELINDSETGFLINSISEIVEKAEYVIENPHIAAKIGSTARDYIINSYSWEKKASEFWELYKEVRTTDLLSV